MRNWCEPEERVSVSSDMGNNHATLDNILAEDMHHWYNKFMKEYPSGLITLFELKSILGLQGMPEDANSYVEQVFHTFDMDGVRTKYEKSIMEHHVKCSAGLSFFSL